MAFVEWLTEKLAAKGVAATDTLATVFAQKQVDLSVVTSDTSDIEMLVLNHRTAPDVPIAWAVRMSMSIPQAWREVVWQESWGTYMGRSKAGNLMVDGGVLSNFPIRLIAESVPQIMGDTDPDAALNLGLLLDEKIAVPGVDPVPPPLPVNELRVVQRLPSDELRTGILGELLRQLLRELVGEIPAGHQRTAPQRRLAGILREVLGQPALQRVTEP